MKISKVTYINYFLIVAHIFILTNCETNQIDIEQRDLLLKKAFSELKSENKDEVIHAIEIIGTYPTYNGVRKLVELWEKDIDYDIEKKLLNSLRKNEEFRKSDSFIEEIFNRNYKKNLGEEKRRKIERLLNKTSANIKKSLLKKLKKTKE